LPVSICSFLQLTRSHGVLFVFLRALITGVGWSARPVLRDHVIRGRGGVPALYIEIRLRGRALDHLHNTDIHAGSSPLARD
jgi:hypothetical protein